VFEVAQADKGRQKTALGICAVYANKVGLRSAAAARLPQCLTDVLLDRNWRCFPGNIPLVPDKRYRGGINAR
jgi:hypothetical protein